MMSKDNHGVSFLAGRYLKGRSRGLISRNHYLTLAGIMLGVMALLCVSSVMNGFREDIGTRIVGTMSEIRISSRGQDGIKDYDKLVQTLEQKGFKASATIRSELLIKRGTIVLPAVSFGIDPGAHAKVSKALNPVSDNGMGVRQGIIAGRVDPVLLENDGIILAAGLASTIGAYLGDEVQIISPRMSIPTAFGMIPRVKSFRVIAIFESAMPEYQQSYAYMSLSSARFFSGTQGVDQLELRSPDFTKAESYARQLQSELPDYKVEPWSRFDASLYSAIRFEKMLMFIIMLLMYVIASFNLTGNLLKSIAQKKRELGLLKSIGFTDRDLRKLFLRQSFILSSIGIGVGLLVATLLLILQTQTGMVKIGSGDGGLVILPVKVMLTDYLIVVLASYLLTFVSVMLPLRRLRQIDPIALIRQTA
ncbi:MAG TPA: ABC transporter permease [Candidatus Cloacimonadota bacterium]|nr:ABC transporter permease [Candidatus Cloacimonadota bacterium]